MSVTIYDLEYKDFERIKLERDLLAEAIADMAVNIGLLDPNAAIRGEHLLMICNDVVDIHEQSAGTV